MKINTSPETAQKRGILQIWGWLVEPAAPQATPEQYLKTKLLSSLFLGLTVLDFFFSPFIILTLHPHVVFWQSPLIYLYIGSLTAFLTGYMLNRNGRYLAGAVTVIVITWFVPVIGILAFPTITTLYLGAMLLIGTAMLGIVLLTRQLATITTTIFGITILLFPVLIPAFTFSTVLLPIIGFVNIVGLLLILTHHTEQIEISRRNELLQTNTSLKVSEARWRSLVDNASTGVYLINNSYQFTYTNSQFSKITGYSPSELVGMDFREILAEDSKQRVADFYINRQQGQSLPPQYESKIVRKDGKIRWVEISASVIHTPDGQPVTIGQLLDITERRQAEVKLRANEEKLQALLQHSSDIVSILTAEGYLLYSSPARERILGFTDEDLATANAFEFVHPDDRALVAKAFSQLLTQPEQPQTMQYRYLCKGGSYIWIETVASNQLHHPAIRGIAANSRDISERKRAEEELKQYRDKLEDLVAKRTVKLQDSESLLRRILESISDGILVLDADYHYTFWNGAMERLSKVPREKLLGTRPWEHFPHLVEQGIDKMIRQAMQGHLVHRGDVPFHLPDGTSGYTTETFLPLYDENGRIRGIVGIVHDITERKQKENALRATNERLQEMDKLKSKFIADISHELRTPVTNLNLYLDLIARGNPEKRPQYEDVIRDQSIRLIGLLDGILNFSNLNPRHQQPAMSAVDFNELVTGSVLKHEANAAAKGVALTFTPDLDLPTIPGVTEQLTIMIDNLLANAVNYTLIGEINVKTEVTEDGDFIYLQVTDTGIGIDEEDLQNCFESFYRGRRIAQLNIAPGIGMGLALVKEIVALHRGRVEVMSQVNKGASFTIFLPIQPSE